jgi:hypothetical protein
MHSLKRSVRCLAIAVAVGVASVSPAYAQTQPTSATTAQALEAVITGVEGLAQVRQSADKPWVKAEVGMTLSESAEFRTGPRSSVRVLLKPDQTFTLDRLGTVSLVEAIQQDKTITTDLAMKYGRVRLDVEAAGVEDRAVIRSASSTLAVRGTKVSLYDQRPFQPEAVSLTSRAEFRNGKKQLAFGARNQGKTVVNQDEPNAAAVALGQAVVDPNIALARTDAEAQIVDNLVSSGSTVFFSQEDQIKVVKGGIPPTDTQLIPSLPGVLNFVARWHTNADLNFSVSAPGGPNNAGETLYPIGPLATSSTGGRVAFDHRGGPNGGVEIIFFPNGYPLGLYGLGLTLITGAPTTAQVDAFLDGERVGIFNGQTVVDSVTVQVNKPIPGFVDGTAVGVAPIGVPLPGAGRTQTQSVTSKKGATAQLPVTQNKGRKRN